MDEKGLEINIDKPLKLDPDQEWICNYLDRLNEKQKICRDGLLPSYLIRGAIAVARNRDFNPDWMAQAAHSYREIIYGLGGKKDENIYLKLKNKLIFYLNKITSGNIGATNKIIQAKSKKENIKKLLEVLNEKKKAEIIANYLYKTYLAFTKIAHHFNGKKSKEATIKIFNELGIKVIERDFPRGVDFDNLVEIFGSTIRESSLDPLEIHREIDRFILDKNQDVAYLNLLFSLNFDAKRYFFSQADGSWVDWLWENGFLDGIKKKAEDQARYVYRLPELDYLTKVATTQPAKVTKILLDGNTATKEENLNPEVIDRFIWIIGNLPVGQIKLLISKISDQKWVYLMRKFGLSGYKFKEIAEKIINGKESEPILELAQAILIVKSKAEMSDRFGEEPFYVHDLGATGIFEALANIEEPNAERALRIVAKAMAGIVKLKESDESGVFEYQDSFVLFDADFFTLDFEGKGHDEDEKNLVVVLKKLVWRTIGAKCGDTKEAKIILSIIDELPTNRSIWRLKLFALAQCPEAFKQELRDTFFKLFEVDNYYEIEGGAEYEKALKIGFPYLTDLDRRDYVKKVFEYFIKKAENDPDQDWHKRTGLEILSSICDDLTPGELKKCEEVFEAKCDRNYEPQPSATKAIGGFVSHKSPVNPADYTISQIIEKLKTEWTPEKLKEQYREDNFLNPRGAEGLADALKEDLKKRTDEYLENINNFFDRNAIHPHYLYSLLRGIEDMLRDKHLFNLSQIDLLLNLFGTIRQSGTNKLFVRDDNKSYLADWIEVNKIMADILLNIVRVKGEPTQKDTRRQAKINIISYLFKIDDPIKIHEKAEYGDLHTIAINSVRGRAFEALVNFTGNDGDILADDTKQIFKDALAIDSLSLRFVVGRYLAVFYFRGEEFVTSLLPEIFPIDNPDKKDIYLATWEGYLSNTLYDKLFAAFNKYYEYAIALDPKGYTERKYWKGLDETLAVHLALAFTHLNLNIGDPLFEQFWAKPNTKRQYEFVSFIGRSVLTRDQVNDEWLKEHNVSKEKLIKFWDWILDNEKINDPKIFSGFDFWIRPDKDKEVLDDNLVIERVARTLKKSDGDVDWDYGLLERLPIFASKNGEKTLEIISSYLLDLKGNLNKNRRTPFLREDRIKEALKTIYVSGNDETRQKVTDLINNLIEKGSNMFWNLKEVISG